MPALDGVNISKVLQRFKLNGSGSHLHLYNPSPKLEPSDYPS